MPLTNLQIARGNRRRITLKRRGQRIIRLGLLPLTRSDTLAVLIARGSFPGVPVIELKGSRLRVGDLAGLPAAA